MTIIKPISLLLALTGLAACSTPLETCVRDAGVPYADALEKKVEIEHTLYRGYAVHEEQVPYQRTSAHISSRGGVGMSTGTAWRTKETPVYVDLENQRDILKDIDDRLPQMEAEWKRNVASCRVSHGAFGHLIEPAPVKGPLEEVTYSEMTAGDDDLPVISVD
jgi:hypothetical protein